MRLTDDDADEGAGEGPTAAMIPVPSGTRFSLQAAVPT